MTEAPVAPTPPPARSPLSLSPRSFRALLLVFGFVAPLPFLADVARHPLELVPCGLPQRACQLGDSAIAASVLGRAWSRFERGEAWNRDDRVFAPYPDSWGLSEGYLAEAIVGYPWARATGSPAAGYNVVYALACMLAFWSSAALFLRLAGPGWPALLGAFLYAWSPGRLNGIAVLTVLWAGLVPLAIAFGLDVLRRGRWRDALLFGVTWFAVGMGSLYGLRHGGHHRGPRARPVRPLFARASPPASSSSRGRRPGGDSAGPFLPSAVRDRPRLRREGLDAHVRRPVRRPPFPPPPLRVLGAAQGRSRTAPSRLSAGRTRILSGAAGSRGAGALVSPASSSPPGRAAARPRLSRDRPWSLGGACGRDVPLRARSHGSRSRPSPFSGSLAASHRGSRLLLDAGPLPVGAMVRPRDRCLRRSLPRGRRPALPCVLLRTVRRHGLHPSARDRHMAAAVRRLGAFRVRRRSRTSSFHSNAIPSSRSIPSSAERPSARGSSSFSTGVACSTGSSLSLPRFTSGSTA